MGAFQSPISNSSIYTHRMSVFVIEGKRRGFRLNLKVNRLYMNINITLLTVFTEKQWVFKLLF